MALKFAKLDRTAIRRLKPGENIAEHGMMVERLADGDLRYTVNVMVDGQRVHRVIGRESTGVTRTQCEEFIEQARTEARSGRLNLPKGRKLALSVAAAATDYIRRLEQGDGKSLPIKRRHLRMYLRPHFGSMRLDAISSFTVDKYKKHRRDQGAAGPQSRHGRGDHDRGEAGVGRRPRPGAREDQGRAAVGAEGQEAPRRVGGPDTWAGPSGPAPLPDRIPRCASLPWPDQQPSP